MLCRGKKGERRAKSKGKDLRDHHLYSLTGGKRELKRERGREGR